MDAANAALRQPDTLFTPSPAAGCQVIEMTIDMPWPNDGGKHDDHAHDHAQHDDDHADIAAEYRFSCTDTAALSGMEIALFSTFPNTERLVLQFVIDDRQGGAVVTRDAPAVRF